MLGTNKFRPKFKGQKGILPLSSSFNRIDNFKRYRSGIIIIGLLILWFLFDPYTNIRIRFYSKSAFTLPPAHPLTSKNVIPTNSKYIYPAVEKSDLLVQLGLNKLFKVTDIRDAKAPDVEQIVVKSLNYFDDVNEAVQKAKEEEENASLELEKVKNNFKNHDKVVYTPKDKNKYPEVVIVTALDFEKYSNGDLVNLVQNRIDYAYQQDYGLYVRYYQEFAPVFNSVKFMKKSEEAKWARIFALRAAMFAFPKAKWFWYLDQDSLIMNPTINLKQYLLLPEALSPVMLREKSIIPPDGLIKTYKNSNAEDMRIIITQSDSKLETYSFLVKNDYLGKCIIESWSNHLFRSYGNFPFGPDSALTHALQWHPYILSKTAIVPARTIAAQQTDVDISDVTNGQQGDHIHYNKGDLVVSWSDCKDTAQCQQSLKKYFDLSKSK